MGDIKTGRPLKYKTKEELVRKIDKYFEEEAYKRICIKGDMKMIYTPTMTGLALYLGFSRKTLQYYDRREEFYPTIKEARMKVEEHYEQLLQHRGGSGVIFALKNFGWSDKEEHEDVTPNKTIEIIYIPK